MGIQAASRNFRVLNKIVSGTGGALGGIAAKAGRGLGGRRAGADLAEMGATNVKIDSGYGGITPYFSPRASSRVTAACAFCVSSGQVLLM